MIITSSRNRKNCLDDGCSSIILDAERLEKICLVIHLGVTFNNHLIWYEQFQAAIKRATFGTAKLNRAKPGLSTPQPVSLYHALVELHLIYCSPVWSATTTVFGEDLAIVQRNAL